MKNLLKDVKKPFAAYKADLKDLEKRRKKLEKALLGYKDALDALAESVGKAESAMGLPQTAIAPAGVAESPVSAAEQVQALQQAFNLQYLQLQEQMQHENRSYTAISNIMKTKHDTVRNSISNVR